MVVRWNGAAAGGIETAGHLTQILITSRNDGRIRSEREAATSHRNLKGSACARKPTHVLVRCQTILVLDPSKDRLAITQRDLGLPQVEARLRAAGCHDVRRCPARRGRVHPQ